MKKLLLILAVLLFAVTANAQLNFGIKGGLNVTEMSLDQSVLETSNRTGFYVGPTLKFSLPVVGLGVDVAALYNQRTMKVANPTEDLDETVEHKTLSIPLNLRYQIIGLGDTAGLFLFTGPQIDFNIGDKKIFDAVDDWKFNSSDFSWNVGLGVMVANHLQVNANYNIGIGKTSDVKDDAIKTVVKSSKENTWQVGLAYYF